MEVFKEMARDIVSDAVGVKGVFGKYKIRFLGSASIGEAVSDEKEGIILFSVDLNEFLFASPTEATFLVEMRERDIDPILFRKMGPVGIEGDL